MKRKAVDDDPTPFSKQEEMPLDVAQVVQYCEEWADKFLKGHGKETYYARLGLLVDFATDLYRDEIQKLKTQTHYHHESYCRKCKEPK